MYNYIYIKKYTLNTGLHISGEKRVDPIPSLVSISAKDKYFITIPFNYLEGWLNQKSISEVVNILTITLVAEIKEKQLITSFWPKG